MSKLRFFKSVLVEITPEQAMEETYPLHHESMTIEERIGNCPECDSNSWILLPKESVAVREGGKQYCECMGCGLTSHL
jgi:hypothetical protein